MAQTLVTDSKAISLLIKGMTTEGRKSLSAAEKRELYYLVNGKEWSSTDSTLTFTYKVNDIYKETTITRTEFNSFKDAEDKGVSAITNDENNDFRQQKIKIAIAQLKARRLDESDACNISDPSDVIAPCCCHYSKTDVNYLLNNSNYCDTVEKAYNILSMSDRYRVLDSEVQKKIDKGDIKLDKESLLEYYHLTEDQIVQNLKTGATASSYTRSPTAEQRQRAANQNTTGEPRDCYSTTSNSGSFTTPNGTTIIAEKDFAQWLLENINVAFRADARKPQIPTSIGASIAMARGVNDSSKLGKWNFWRFPYDPSLTSLEQDSDYCAFSNSEQGINAILVALHSDQYKGAVSTLKDTMGEASDADKDSATSAIAMILGGNDAIALTKSALDYVTKYDMRKWDTDEKEEDGGHSDTKKNSSEIAQGVQDKLAKSVKRTSESVAEKGMGVLLKPVDPKHTRVIKLPKGKTPCEPIYPDFVTVGDTIPEWVFSESYANMAKAAEEAALKAAGIPTQSDDEIQLEYLNNKILAFKEQQFASWVQSKGISYSSEAEKATAKQRYAEDAAADPENFTDGIWTPNEATRSVYKALLQEKASIQYNGDTATARAHLKYLEASQSTAATISDREGSWNQNTGGTYSAATGDTISESITATTVTNASVEAMVSWAISIASDQSHGYSQGAGIGSYTGSREGPDYDCSSLVYYALQQGGFNVIGNRGYVGVADSGLWDDLSKISGWKKYNYADVKDSIQRGDILMYLDHHVAIAISPTRTVEATGVLAGGGSYETGDQDREIDFYNIAGRPWDEVYRYQGG